MVPKFIIKNKLQSGNYNIYTMWRGPMTKNAMWNRWTILEEEYLIITDNTNIHDLILTHSLSRFTLPRCALHKWTLVIIQGYGISNLVFGTSVRVTRKLCPWLNRLVLGFRTSHELREDCFGSRLPITIHALMTKLQATCATGLARTQSLMTSDFNRQTDRQRFSLSLLVSHTRKRDGTHTHTQCDKLWCWMPLQLPGYDLCTVQPFSA